MIQDIIEGWQKMNRRCYKEFNNDNEFPEFYHSITEGINSGFYYKFINGYPYILKLTAFMGRYSMINYASPLTENPCYDDLLRNNIGIRGANVKGTKDSYGAEFIYSADEFTQMNGSKFRSHRNIIKRFSDKIHVLYGMNKDVEIITENWTKARGEKHQLKLLKTIILNARFLNIIVLYYKQKPIGFSVVERINEKAGNIIMRLINPIPEAYELKEPNYLLHYFDCLNNNGMNLNIGSSVGIKNMELAKRKLVPIKEQTIFRVSKPMTKDIYELFKFINQ